MGRRVARFGALIAISSLVGFSQVTFGADSSGALTPIATPRTSAVSAVQQALDVVSPPRVQVTIEPAVGKRSYSLARNQFGDHWQVVVDARNRLTLRNDHEQLSGEIKQYRFVKGVHSREAQDWPISVGIDPEETTVSFVTEEGRRTLHFISKRQEIVVRFESAGNRFFITMAVQEFPDAGRERVLLRKAVFDFEPFQGRGELHVGRLKTDGRGLSHSEVFQYHALGLGNGYALELKKHSQSRR
jgi:hypothetical protein